MSIKTDRKSYFLTSVCTSVCTRTQLFDYLCLKLFVCYSEVVVDVIVVTITAVTVVVVALAVGDATVTAVDDAVAATSDATPIHLSKIRLQVLYLVHRIINHICEKI